MSINIIPDDSKVEYIYCDMCRNGDCLYKCANFKQYNGWYCRNCYELIDEDLDENLDDNFVIKMNMLKTFIEVSNPYLGKYYYYQKLVCSEIKKIEKFTEIMTRIVIK